MLPGSSTGVPLHVAKASIALATDAGGDAEAVSEVIIGLLSRFVLVLPGVNPLDDAGTVTITKTETGEVVATGTVAEFAPDGSITAPAMPMSSETLTITVESGGATKTGTLVVYWR